MWKFAVDVYFITNHPLDYNPWIFIQSCFNLKYGLSLFVLRSRTRQHYPVISMIENHIKHIQIQYCRNFILHTYKNIFYKWKMTTSAVKHYN